MTNQELSNVIDELHTLGYTDTAGKEPRELIQMLAVLRITRVEVKSPHSSWF